MTLFIFTFIIVNLLIASSASAREGAGVREGAQAHADLKPRDGGRQILVVQLDGPTHTEDLDRLLGKSGARLVGYLPDQTYIVWAGESARQKIGELASKEDFIRRYSRYRPDQKLATSLKTPSSATKAPGSATKSATVWVAVTSVSPEGPSEYSVVKVDRDRLGTIASRPDVISVQPWSPPRLLDERQGMIMVGSRNPARTGPAAPGYLSWLIQRGFPSDPSAYPIVDVADDGFDNGDAIAPAHDDFYRSGEPVNASRMAYAVDLTTDNEPHGAGGHGTINLSILGGYNDSSLTTKQDSSGYNHGLGISPFGRMGSTKIFNDRGEWDVAPYFEGIMSDIYGRGARISSNSWGTTSPDVAVYDMSASIYDRLVSDASTSPGLQPMTFLFAAGNEGELGASTISLPGTAKNVITVGAAESFRPEEVYSCMAPQDGNNVQDIARFSGRGPTSDGRIKPEIVAPGTRILGAASQGSFYTANSVCQAFYPYGQLLYTWSSGTSHATPAVSGATSLIYNQFTRMTGQPPSPAMTKALLVNGARYMTGVSANDRLPSRSQGFGIVDLSRNFDGAKKFHLDQRFRISTSGQYYSWSGMITDLSKQTRITLAWTDPPATPGTTKALINDLDLEVVIDGKTYRGNYFSLVTKQFSAVSTSATQRDSRNNIESITIPAGSSGRIDVRVRGRSIAGDGVLGNGDTTDQDFALVAYNARSTIPMSIHPGSAKITYGNSAKLFGWLQNANSVAIAGALVFVQSQQPDGRWVTVGSNYTNVNGYYSRWVKPAGTQRFRAYYPGSGAVPPGATTQSTVQVSAKPGLGLSTYRLSYGKPVKVTAWVSPAHPGKLAYLQAWDSRGGRWRWVKTLRLGTSSYNVSWWTPPWRAKWPLRLYFPGDTDHLPGASATRTLTVN